MQIDLELYREDVELPAESGPGRRLSVIDIAPEQPQQTMLFIHGFGGNARQWQHQIEPFAERNRVLAPDLPGHGRSSRLPAGYGMEALVADLAAMLAEQGVTEPVVLAGHSFGGAIATDFALAYPQRVSRLVLIATAEEFRLFWPYRVAFHLPPPVLRAAQPAVSSFVNASLTSMRRMYWQILVPWQGEEKFPRLDVPVLVIRGERDRVLPQAAFTRVSELVPDDNDINVGASAHMVMIERRDAVNRAIERFIDDRPAVPAEAGWRSGRAGVDRRQLLAERPWLVHYESGVPHTLDIPRLPLTRLLERSVRRFSHRPAITFQGRTLNYQALQRDVERFARALAALGAGPGRRVMLLLPNIPHLVVAYYGTLLVGGIVVMSNPRAEAEELARQARDAGAELLVTMEEMQPAATVIRARSDVRAVVYARRRDYATIAGRLGAVRRNRDGLSRPPGPQDHHWHELLRAHREGPLPRADLSADDVAVIQYTGGTTARPRGVTLTHFNLVANALQLRVWMPTARDGEESVLCVVPFSHVYGMTVAMNLAVAIGARMILLPEFDTRQLLETIKKEQPSLFPGVPSIFTAITNHPDVRRFDVQSIRACLSGAAPLPVEVEESFEKLTRGRLVEGYGLAEASPVTHANPVFGEEKVGSIGLPLPNTEAKIVDLRTDIFLPVPSGHFGELVVRGPQVMRGYWGNREATRAVLDADGWLRTGDVGRMDEDGYFQIISRRADMWRGEDAGLIFPRDVEEVLYELPEVQEVVVVGVAGRAVAFVQLKDGANVDADSIQAYARRRLPPAQRPRMVIFVKEFPRSFIGKVLRRELVSQYAHQIEAQAGTVGDYLRGLEQE